MKLETKCPKCGLQLDDNRAIVNTADQFACNSCGNVGDLGEFLTRGSRERILKAAQQAALDALKNISGFKK